MNRARAFLRDCRGAAALEFALVGLPFILLILGLIEFGRVLHVKAALDAAADRAQRVVLIDPATTDADLDTQILTNLNNLEIENLTVRHAVETVSETEYRLVTLVYDMVLVVPMSFGSTVSLVADRRILQEP